MLFGKIGAGTDVVVRTHAPYAQTEGVGTNRGPIAEDVLDQVRGVDGVRVAEGSVQGYALLTDTDGRAITTNGGAPTNGYSMPADEGLRGDVELLTGHAPTNGHEVAIDATSAADHDIALGSTIKVLFQGPTREFTVVGTVGYGDGITDLGGTTSAYFDTATAQRVLGTPGDVRPDRRRRRGRRGPVRARRPDLRRRPRRRRGGDRRRGRAGERRRHEEELQHRRHPLRDLRRHRALRGQLHHLEHLHDDRLAAAARDRAAAGDRGPAPPGPRQPAGRGAGAGAARLGGRLRARCRRGEGAEVADGLHRPGAALHLAAGRAVAAGDRARGRHRRHGRRRARPGPPRHEGAADRGAARVDPRRRAALAAARPGRPGPAGGRCGRPAGRAVRRRRHEAVRARAGAPRCSA